MKSHRFLSIALMACVAAVSVAVAAVRSVSEFIVDVALLAKSWLFETMRVIARTDDKLKAPAVMLVQAKAVVMRLAKRERPVVTNSWRMCPSI